MGNLGFQELLIILLIVVVLFGASRIPQIMGGLGEGIKNFKKALREEEKEGGRSEKADRENS